jgi:transposase
MQLIQHFVAGYNIKEAASMVGIPYEAAKKVVTSYRKGEYW